MDWMDDTISRQQTIDAINTWDKFGVDERNRIIRWHEGLEPYVRLRDVLIAIVNLPAAQPQRKKGRWVEVTDGTCIWKVCDQCGEKPLWNEWRTDRCESNFCPNCGADMREVTT